MTDFERVLLAEVSSLPPSRQADVLAFIRYLKLSIPEEESEINERFDKALTSMRTRAKRLKITQKDIDSEISAVRSQDARHP
jgi:hypothetical protein